MTVSPLDAQECKSCCAGLYELPLTRLLLGSSFHPGGVELTKRLARGVALGPGDRVLDLASGRGDTALFLAKKYGAEVVGLDYSSSQVEEATERAKAEGIASRVTFVEGDAEELPFDDASFDIVMCECALCTFPRRDRALSEAYRVLKARGSIALSDVTLNREVPDELSSIVGQVLCINGAMSQLGYTEALSSAGFRKVRFLDASATLFQLIEQIESRSNRWSDLNGLEGPLDQEALGSALQAGRSFIESKGMGYATFTARK